MMFSNDIKFKYGVSDIIIYYLMLRALGVQILDLRLSVRPLYSFKLP